jgi:UDP-N-acetylmuramyl pentapeptide synthase
MKKAFNFCGITDKKWYPSYIELLQDSDEIKKWFSGCDVFLIKGSRGMQLEKTLAIWE